MCSCYQRIDLKKSQTSSLLVCSISFIPFLLKNELCYEEKNSNCRMKCQVKLTLCVVLLPLCMLTKGQIIYDTELQRNGLNEELKRQLNGVNLRTTALYNVVRTMEQSLLEQGLLEKPSNTDSIELGMSYDVNSKLLSLEKMLEREITNSRHQDKTLHSRMHLLESEITVMASNIKHVASYVQSKTTKSRKL